MSGKKVVHELSSEALFRLQLVSAVVVRLERGDSSPVVLAEVAQSALSDLTGRRRRVSMRTLQRWVSAYRQQGPGGLEPEQREQVADSTCLSREFLDFLKLEKKLDPRASLPEVIARARLKGVLKRDEPIDRTSVWRAARRLGLPLTRPGRLREQDMQRFAHRHRMQMVLVDGARFRAGADRLRRVAVVFLDDASRYGLEAVVGTQENAELFLEGLHDEVRRHGLMLALYLDNGSGFIALDSRQAVARLCIHLIFGTAGYPQGHGKIEAFNKTFRNRCLRGFDGKPEVDPAPQALRLRVKHWLEEDYNHMPHQGLGGLTPAERWLSDERPLEFPADRALLDEAFIVSFRRHVSNDNVISYKSGWYEVPRGYGDSWITVRRHLLENNRLTILHDGKDLELHPVDLARNAYSRRSKSPGVQPTEPDSPPTTAGDLAFEAAYPPLVDPDGGYIGDTDDE
jgi:transposase InsO family protein